MEKKKFGSTNLEVSPICMGTWGIVQSAFWDAIDERDAVAAFDAMLENGVNIIDTAPAYAYGASETMVGKAIEGKRDQVVLITKTAVIDSPMLSMPMNDGRYHSIIRQVDDSLARLRTDYVDVLMMHWPDPETPMEESMRALAEVKKAGKARLIGVSNFTEEQLEEAEQYLKIDVLQLPYSMVNRTQEERAKWAAGRGIAIMSYGSLGGGVLTGVYRSLPKFAETDARSRFYDTFQEPRFSKIQGLLSVMDEIAEAHDTTPAGVAIKWNTEKEFIHTAICGVRSGKEAQENCKALNWTMSEEEMQTLDNYIENVLDA